LGGGEEEAEITGSEKLKQFLGLGPTASEEGVIEAVESQAKSLKEIREALGLPPDSR
jgi:hypothetical protein